MRAYEYKRKDETDTVVAENGGPKQTIVHGQGYRLMDGEIGEVEDMSARGRHCLDGVEKRGLGCSLVAFYFRVHFWGCIDL